MSNNYFKVLATQAVTLSLSSQQLSMSDPRTLYLRIASGPTPAYYKTGSNPTATSSDAYLPQNWIDYIQISPGEKIAILGTAASNAVSVSELTS